MQLIKEVLKETTDQDQPLDIYISERKHDDSTPKDWVSSKTHKFVVVFHFTGCKNPNYGHSYYIDTIMDSYWGGDDGGLTLFKDRWTYESLSAEKMLKVRRFIQKFVDINNLNLHKEESNV